MGTVGRLVVTAVARAWQRTARHRPRGSRGRRAQRRSSRSLPREPSGVLARDGEHLLWVWQLVEEDPRVRTDNPMWENVEHPEVGTYRMPGSPLGFSSAERVPVGRAPQLGEHTEAILAGLLGLGTAEIGRLHDAGSSAVAETGPVAEALHGLPNCAARRPEGGQTRRPNVAKSVATHPGGCRLDRPENERRPCCAGPSRCAEEDSNLHPVSLDQALNLVTRVSYPSRPCPRAQCGISAWTIWTHRTGWMLPAALPRGAHLSCPEPWAC
jgi:hypothetical protein